MAVSRGHPSIESSDALYSYQYDQGEEDYSDYNYDDEEEELKDTADSSVLTHRPVIVSQSKNIVVDNGLTISLPCLVDKLPAGMQIIWNKVDDTNTIIAIGSLIHEPEYKGRAFVTMNDKGSTLAIGAAKSSDAGQYKCSVAVEGNRPEIKHTVSIKAPPSIKSTSPSILEAKKGDDVTLDCKGFGSPQPSVKWTRVGKNMPDGESFLEDEVITFSSVTRKHAGTYKCTASNGHGSGASKLVEVVVEYEPEIEVTEMLIHSRRGDKVELVCTVHAFPAPKVTWSKGGVEVTGEEVANRGSRHSLTLVNIGEKDYGEYKCLGVNSKGQAEEMIEVTGHAEAPVFKSSPTGHSDDSFLVEWSTKSFSPVSEFLLETRPAAFSTWVGITVTPTTEGSGPYHFAGKQILSDLQPATQYVARVSARNEEGWSRPGEEWNFATVGAAPSASAKTSSSTSTLPNLTFLCALVVAIMSLTH